MPIEYPAKPNNAKRRSIWRFAPHSRRPALGPNDPPDDLSREEAAYQRERERLVRDHLGKVALICGDDVIGVFDNCDDGLLEGYRRFGDVEMVLRLIEEDDGPFYTSLVDINHPSLRRVT
jgi:hypothetical protein